MSVHADCTPELRQPLSRLLGAAAIKAVGEHDRVHGAGGCAGNRLDVQAAVRQQLIEDAPGERSVCAASLQREIDPLAAPVANALRTWWGDGATPGNQRINLQESE